MMSIELARLLALIPADEAKGVGTAIVQGGAFDNVSLAFPSPFPSPLSSSLSLHLYKSPIALSRYAFLLYFYVTLVKAYFPAS